MTNMRISVISSVLITPYSIERLHVFRDTWPFAWFWQQHSWNVRDSNSNIPLLPRSWSLWTAPWRYFLISWHPRKLTWINKDWRLANGLIAEKGHSHVPCYFSSWIHRLRNLLQSKGGIESAIRGESFVCSAPSTHAPSFGSPLHIFLKAQFKISE